MHAKRNSTNTNSYLQDKSDENNNHRERGTVGGAITIWRLVFTREDSDSVLNKGKGGKSFNDEWDVHKPRVMVREGGGDAADLAGCGERCSVHDGNGNSQQDDRNNEILHCVNCANRHKGSSKYLFRTEAHARF
ncbi:hypothetical protein O1611_g6146 [Lasiodiplodia mahajangana]|uniref:Uncharacterized protein n=1 Tax=Lasiodiplodia mahajangana TaxID=1108764 RepID=A0ACC2JJ10_9PEZI|nr:hypothetical protein O1611_g6146 [Lasiodiplodia mahajangana]